MACRNEQSFGMNLCGRSCQDSLPQNTDSIAKFSAYLKATADFAVLSSASIVLKPIPVATRQPRLTVTFMQEDSSRSFSH